MDVYLMREEALEKFSSAGIISTAWDAARWQHSHMAIGASPQSETALAERHTPNPLVEDEWGSRKTWLLLEEVRRTRVVEAERSLRAILGMRLYEFLCPESCTSLMGVEYLLQDESFPDPTLVITGLALAFENQLKIRVLAARG